MISGKLLAFTASLLLFLALAAEGQPPPGFGPKGPKDGFKGGPKGKADSSRLVEDLNLKGEIRDKAHRAVKAYDEKVREQTIKAREELVAQMKDILPAAEFQTFKDELAQVPLIPAPNPGPRGVPTDDLTERVMAFDLNKDGKVSKDELPARMQSLFDEGDTNKDGFLDADEIKRLAARNAQPRGPGNGPPGGGPGGGPPGRPQRP
jgi:hypothetical protein